MLQGGENIKKYLASSLPNKEEQQTFWEYFGYCMTQDTQFQKFLTLKGNGGIRKSVAVSLIQHVVGITNMQVMFGACLRVSETIGLTWSDVDMKNREIHVGGQLVYYEGDEGYCFHDSETKTDAGIRDIPMTQRVYDAFR